MHNPRQPWQARPAAASIVMLPAVAGIGYDKLANTFLEYENTKIYKTLILLIAPSANINILDLPPLVSQSCLTLFLTVARGCEIGTRVTCIRVAKVERLPQS